MKDPVEVALGVGLLAFIAAIAALSLVASGLGLFDSAVRQARRRSVEKRPSTLTRLSRG